MKFIYCNQVWIREREIEKDTEGNSDIKDIDIKLIILWLIYLLFFGITTSFVVLRLHVFYVMVVECLHL